VERDGREGCPGKISLQPEGNRTEGVSRQKGGETSTVARAQTFLWSSAAIGRWNQREEKCVRWPTTATREEEEKEVLLRGENPPSALHIWTLQRDRQTETHLEWRNLRPMRRRGTCRPAAVRGTNEIRAPRLFPSSDDVETIGKKEEENPDARYCAIIRGTSHSQQERDGQPEWDGNARTSSPSSSPSSLGNSGRR